jgi:quinohemoprotein ethanol dehydrogenase
MTRLPFQADPAFKLDPAKVERGRALVGAHCGLCHGAGLRAGGAAPDLRSSPVPLDAGSFAAVVSEGALVPNGMPRFAEFSPDELDAMRHFIRSEARAAISGKAASQAAPTGASEGIR